MKVTDIEINTLNINAKFILEDKSEKILNLNSLHLSDTTITKIFDDLSKVNLTKEQHD